MNKNLDRSKKVSNSTKLLIALSELANVTIGHFDAFLMSRGSASQLACNVNMLEREYSSAFQGLCRHGYIKRVNENQFLITPKAHRKIRIIFIESSEWRVGKWDGFWKIISFDIPETKKSERNIFRSLIKRKGFVGVQQSVFVAPFADFEALALLRQDLKIEKYVSFFTAQSYLTDDDTKLRKRFNLK